MHSPSVNESKHKCDTVSFSLIIGMAFGTGSAVAHRAVDAVMGPRTIQHETVASEAAASSAPTMNNVGGSDACNAHSKAFQDVCTSFPFSSLCKILCSIVWSCSYKFIIICIFKAIVCVCILVPSSEWIKYMPRIAPTNIQKTNLEKLKKERE